MKKAFLSALLALCLLPGLAPLGVLAGDGGVSAQESAGAPPARFDIYIQVGGGESLLLGSYTGTQMRAWAQQKNPSGALLKYSAQSYYGAAGRIVKEYLKLEDFFELLSDDLDLTVSFASGDYFIMGEDLTKDQDLVDAGYSEAQLKGNWYSWDSLLGTARYYFPNWDSGSETGAVEAPSVIGIRSYGGSSGMSDGMLNIYAGSADYLWAYVVYYGQTAWSEVNYPYFYYGQTQAILDYPGDAAANATVTALLDREIATAADYLYNTATATSAAEVAQGDYWVTAQQYGVLQTRLAEAREAAAEEATNESAFGAARRLMKANENFAGQRQMGEKTGYFWYTEHDPASDTYVLSTAGQLWELCELVNGAAYDESSGYAYERDDFAGKTVLLDRDIDAAGMRIHIGGEESAFEGTFDGRGHTVSNLSITGLSDYAAFFGQIGESGAVKNLAVSGVSKGSAGTTYAGGLAAYNEGLIENCVSSMTVTDTGANAAGGVAAYNEGTIRGCINTGAVAGSGGAGGIAGMNAGTITACIDTALPLTGTNGGALSNSYTLGDTAVSSGAAGNNILTGADTLAETAPETLNAGLETPAFRAVGGGYPALSWQEVYDVYFDLLLGGNLIEPVRAARYLPVPRPADPAARKPGADGTSVADGRYRFDGWYADDARTVPFDFSAPTNGDATLYARWFRMGDLDFDGRVNARDAMLLLRHVAGAETLDADALSMADVDGDGWINSGDCAAILRIGIGKEV